MLQSIHWEGLLVKNKASGQTTTLRCPKCVLSVMNIIQMPIPCFTKSQRRRVLLYLSPPLRHTREWWPLEGCTKRSCLESLKRECHSLLGFKMRKKKKTVEEAKINAKIILINSVNIFLTKPVTEAKQWQKWLKDSFPLSSWIVAFGRPNDVGRRRGAVSINVRGMFTPAPWWSADLGTSLEESTYLQ